MWIGCSLYFGHKPALHCDGALKLPVSAFATLAHAMEQVIESAEDDSVDFEMG